MKKKLFWILYFGISAVAITLVAVTLRKHIIFNCYSSAPLIYFIFHVYIAWLANPKREKTPNTWYELNRRLCNLAYDRRVGFYEKSEEEQDTIIKHAMEKGSRILFVGLLILTPLVFLCVFLFPYYIKLLSGLPFVILSYIVWAFDMAGIRAGDRQKEKMLQKEREEQERREELGRWK